VSEQAAADNAETDPRVDLAVERTELALERTQLAWVRTVFGLYTAGIAVDKGVEILRELKALPGQGWVQHAQLLGIALAIMGMIFSGLTTVLFFRRAKALARMRTMGHSFLGAAALLSIIACILGVLLTSFLIAVG